MATREISREEWTDFFDSFSRRHEGWLVTMEVLGSVGAQVEARELPLLGIASDRDGGNTISIIVGATEERVTHIIGKPTHVRVEETAAGVDRALQVESESGETTLISFRSAVSPEMVDGVLPER